MKHPLMSLSTDGEAAEILLARSPRFVRGTLFLLTGLLGAGLVWSYLGWMDTYISARGVVRPRGDLVRVQPVEGGRLRDVLVKVGETVEEGSILFRIDGRDVESNLEKVRSRLASGRQQLALQRSLKERLESQQLLEARRDEIEVERAEWELKKATSKKNQAEALLSESEARLADAKARYERSRELWRDKLISLEEHEQKKADLNVSSALQRSAHAMLQTALDEISLLEKSRDFMKEQASVSKQERRRAIEEFDTKILALENGIRESALEENRLLESLRDFEVTAPLAGTITEVAAQSAGEVVRAGDTLATLAPLGVSWIVEAFVPNQEAGPLREKVGHRARIKLDAYPFRDYGTIDGRLLTVSPDAEQRETLHLAYRVEIDLDSLSVKRGRREGHVSLGMAATVEIIKEEERILMLLFRGIRDRVSYD